MMKNILHTGVSRQHQEDRGTSASFENKIREYFEVSASLTVLTMYIRDFHIFIISFLIVFVINFFDTLNIADVIRR